MTVATLLSLKLSTGLNVACFSAVNIFLSELQLCLSSSGMGRGADIADAIAVCARFMDD